MAIMASWTSLTYEIFGEEGVLEAEVGDFLAGVLAGVLVGVFLDGVFLDGVFLAGVF